MFWTSQEFPEPLRTAPQSAESRPAQDRQRCFGTGGGLPRAGRSAAVSEQRLAACTHAKLPGAGATVPAAGRATLRTVLGTGGLQAPTRSGAGGNL